MGRYDVLRGFGSNEPPERVNPYHPIQLFEHTPWLGKVEITSDVRDFHIPQLRNSDPAKRKVYVVKPQPLSGQYFNQYFLLSNHQGDAGSPILQFDANYQGKGLLIWHVLPAKAWDLESAGGEVPDVRLGQIFDPIPPGAPILRGDALARSWTFAGSGADFYSDFYGVTDFSATTNPNSNYYSEFFDFFSPQDVVSHIGVENIRQDASGDMIVDIYVDPKQYLTSPNGGEVIPAGNPLTVTWLHRPNAAISTVNIAISSNGGQTYDPLFGVSNTSGQYTIPPLYGFLSTQNRIKITSLDATTNAFDESDANFTRWGINQDSTFQPTITHRCIGTTPKVKVSVNFTTSVASDGDDVLQVFTNSSCTGTPIGTATVANPSHTPKTTHTIWWEGTCSGSPGAFYVVVKSQHGSGWAASQCTYVGTVTCISCGACSPPPCVYD